jgi:hypothetical protein
LSEEDLKKDESLPEEWLSNVHMKLQSNMDY